MLPVAVVLSARQRAPTTTGKGPRRGVSLARAQIETFPAKFYFLDGLIDKILGKMETKMYDLTIKGHAPIEERLKAARKEEAD